MNLWMQWLKNLVVAVQEEAAGLVEPATRVVYVRVYDTDFPTHLFWGYMVIWISIAVYLWHIASRQSELRRELRGLRAVTEEKSASQETR